MPDAHVELRLSEIESLSKTALCAEAIVVSVRALPVLCKGDWGAEPLANMLRQIRESADKLDELLSQTEHLLFDPDMPRITMPLTGKSVTFCEAAHELAFHLRVITPDDSTETIEVNWDATRKAIECFGDSYSPRFLERLERLIAAEAQGAKLRARAGYLPAAAETGESPVPAMTKGERGAKSAAGSELSGEEKALAMLLSHPEWSDTRIAEEIGFNRTTLYKWNRYKAARAVMKQGRDSLPRGQKDAKTGDLEAWE